MNSRTEFGDTVDRTAGVHPAAMLRRVDVLGAEARQPEEPVAEDPDAPQPAPYPPDEQGDEGP